MIHFFFFSFCSQILPHIPSTAPFHTSTSNRFLILCLLFFLVHSFIFFVLVVSLLGVIVHYEIMRMLPVTLNVACWVKRLARCFELLLLRTDSRREF